MKNPIFHSELIYMDAENTEKGKKLLRMVNSQLFIHNRAYSLVLAMLLYTYIASVLRKTQRHSLSIVSLFCICEI